MEVGEEGDYIYLSLHCHHQKREIIYTYRYTVTTRMALALIWAAMTAID